ncbi:DUF4402 domain-containing protein [Chitinophaga dinghuensis]|nr:DUF4402 domain-containing protein [Chitinophaga dinghuensis]
MKNKLAILSVINSMLLMSHCLPAKAQVSLTTMQSLSFGTFCIGPAGGTISISPADHFIVTGDIIPIGKGIIGSPIIIEMEAPIGTKVTLLETKSLLRGNNGNTMTLRLNGTDPATPFITRQTRTSISIGATLNVSGAGSLPAGKYDGQLFITFLAGE